MEMVSSSIKILSWESYNEDVSALDYGSTITALGLLEQINMTRDSTDYLWCKTSVDINPSESFFHGGDRPTLIVESTGHAVHVFVNGQLIGSSFGGRKNRRFTFNKTVNLQPGANKTSLLSIAVGLLKGFINHQCLKRSLRKTTNATQFDPTKSWEDSDKKILKIFPDTYSKLYFEVATYIFSTHKGIIMP
ncbi:hypothetical protein BVRB_8g189390 [Beta vulgaris subsp. vulgaris]|nr:hypothetical protein BVRB_8g189390 [Beta vulgaris subsp. vulgaris]